MHHLHFQYDVWDYLIFLGMLDSDPYLLHASDSHLRDTPELFRCLTRTRILTHRQSVQNKSSPCKLQRRIRRMINKSNRLFDSQNAMKSLEDHHAYRLNYNIYETKIRNFLCWERSRCYVSLSKTLQLSASISKQLEKTHHLSASLIRPDSSFGTNPSRIAEVLSSQISSAVIKTASLTLMLAQRTNAHLIDIKVFESDVLRFWTLSTYEYL